MPGAACRAGVTCVPIMPVVSPEEMRSLYVDHHPWLQGWFRQRMGDAHQAADLAHDTFMRLLAGGGAGRARPLRAPRAYLKTVASRLLVDHWRRQDIERSYLAVLAAQPEASAPSPEVRMLVIESLMEIVALLERLKPQVREVFLLVRIEGLSCPQAAARIGRSVATVERHLAQALAHCYRLAYGA